MPDYIYNYKKGVDMGCKKGSMKLKSVCILQEQFKSYNSIFTLIVSEM